MQWKEKHKLQVTIAENPQTYVFALLKPAVIQNVLYWHFKKSVNNQSIVEDN